ncbi:MAG TPA: sulfatase [Sphingopyxis sp.]|nr:sulfatase [Sphingopyxis sp.]
MRNKRIAFALLGAAALAGCTTGSRESIASRPVAPGRPNIILITAEDMSPRLGVFGDPVAVTPNIDRLASEGITFTRAFTTAGVCAPSRSALITGVHQQSLGTMHMRTSMFGRDMAEGAPYEAVTPPEVKAFPELLRRAGYYAVNDVKTDYQFGTPFSVWDQVRDGADWNERAPGQPFFLMINHEVTHEGWTWMPGTDPAAHPTAAKTVARNVALHAKLGFAPTDPAKVRVPPYYPDTPKVRADIAWYYDNIRVMDRQVGELLDRLRAEGRFDDSIIIFMTDHGDGLPRGKRTIFDSGTHVPLIVRFPDRRGAGTKRGDLVSAIDLAPTVLGWAKAPVPRWIQGRDLFGDPAPQAVFMGGDRFDEVPQRFRGIREARYHYIRYFSDKPVIPALAYQNVNPIMQEWRRLFAEGRLTPLQRSYLDAPPPREMLFDTATDPDEVVNLADDPEFAVIKRRLSARLDRWIVESGDMGREPESRMVERMWPNGAQPVTASVTACRVANGKTRLTSATPGASIGWGGPKGEQHLYVAPLAATSAFVSAAVRYGYRASDPVTIDPAKLDRC